MVYAEQIKIKHQNKIDMKLSVFREDLQLPYSLGTSLKPDNDSPTTMRELKYLGSLKTNKNLVEDGDDIKENFIPLIDENEIPISKTYVERVIKESAKFVMKMKYHYNRPRPYQVAEVYGINLKGHKTDSMNTPSYPSGHAIQGYLVAELFSYVDPKNSKQYREIGETIAHSRINAKAHYPSDKKFGSKVADILFKGLIKK